MFTIRLKSFKCIEETDEVGSDEPYVLVVAADVSSMVPNIDVVRYGPWDPVWKGEWHHTVDSKPLVDTISTILTTLGQELPSNAKDTILDSIYEANDKVDRPFWGMNSRPQVIKNPDDLIFVVALMENDNGDPGGARIMAKSAAVASLASSINMNRKERVDRLIADVKDVLAIPTGAPNFDDRVGPPRELRIYQQDLDDLVHVEKFAKVYSENIGKVISGQASETNDFDLNISKIARMATGFIEKKGDKSLLFQGDGGRYRLIFSIMHH